MSADVNQVANQLIALGLEHSHPLTPLEVQKLLYFVDGWHLALTKTPLIDEEFQAWARGPVIPSIYDRLKAYSGCAIPRSEIRSTTICSLSELALDLIRRVYETYKEHDPGSLVGLTHLPNSPWDQTRAEHGLRKNEASDVVIKKSLMERWFSEVWKVALEPANSEIIWAEPDDYADWLAVA